MGPIWGWQDPGGLQVGPMKFAIWEGLNLQKTRYGSVKSVFCEFKNTLIISIFLPVLN